MTPHCGRCPEPPDRPCCGNLCHVAGDPTWDRHILGRNAFPCPGAEPAPAPPPPEPAAVLRDRRLAESLRLLSLAKACPHRDERTDCGCGGLATCGIGKGRNGIVNITECIACQVPPTPHQVPRCP